jgi:metal-responsive CopG/Arc/MetJ family transcriptional regulator
MNTLTLRRKRANFMFKATVLEELEELIPAGSRSEFVNDVVEEALIQFSRKKAFELIDEFKKTHRHKKMADEELLKDIRYGRRS